MPPRRRHNRRARDRFAAQILGTYRPPPDPKPTDQTHPTDRVSEPPEENERA